MGPHPDGGAVRRHRQRQAQIHIPAGQTDGVAVHPGTGQNILAAGQTGGGDAPGVCKDLPGGSGPQHLAAVHDDHLPAQAVGLIPVVGDQQGRAPKGGEQSLHLALHFLPQIAVQGAEGFVQHQNLRPPHQNPGQGGALLLSARQFAGAVPGHPFQPHGPQHLPAAGTAGGRVLFGFQAAEDILLHRHMGKQGVILKQQPHPSLLGRQVDPPFTVEQHPAIQHNAAPVRPDNPRDTAQGHAFAAARRPQNRGGGVSGGEPGAEGKALKGFFDVDFQTHGRTPAFCLRSSRLTASSTTAEMAMSTRTHCKAPASSLVRQSWYTVVAMVAVLPGV